MPARGGIIMMHHILYVTRVYYPRPGMYMMHGYMYPGILSATGYVYDAWICIILCYHHSTRHRALQGISPRYFSHLELRSVFRAKQKRGGIHRYYAMDDTLPWGSRVRVRLACAWAWWSLPKMVNHCGIHSDMSSGFATTCVLRRAFLCGKTTIRIT